MLEGLCFVICTVHLTKLNTEKDDDDDANNSGGGSNSSNSDVMIIMKHLKLFLPNNVCALVCYRCVQNASI
jgi:hypothetical protein